MTTKDGSGDTSGAMSRPRLPHTTTTSGDGPGEWENNAMTFWDGTGRYLRIPLTEYLDMIRWLRDATHAAMNPTPPKA